MSNKIINDPVHGFVDISNPLLLKIIDHPYFQRLKRISQTGLTFLVYPGAIHTRFHHAIGATHLMKLSLQVLKSKGIKISNEEEEASLIAILLHDIGHGPFSHALESTILEGMHHENISLYYFELLNEEFNGSLELAIKIFKNEYKRPFFHQLISSQLDVDRLDYLKRDSFFTGVSEGNIGSERIITMFNVVDDELVTDIKGIYSIEKYLTSRMFMYWQVYFHKTSASAEIILIKVFERAKELVQQGKTIPTSRFFNYFLNLNQKAELNKKNIEHFTQIDDTDVYTSLKEWQFYDDKILAMLSSSIINRELPKSIISIKKHSEEELVSFVEKTEEYFGIENGNYFINQKKLTVNPYNLEKKPIKLLTKNKSIIKLEDAENQVLTSSLSQKISRYHLMIPRKIYDSFC
ncbi:MAG: HD domain-containing protein [Flavobacteriales bacterium]|nr:HD domain-containing protein [Flavobacteriales bacterium]